MPIARSRGSIAGAVVTIAAGLALSAFAIVSTDDSSFGYGRGPVVAGGAAFAFAGLLFISDRLSQALPFPQLVVRCITASFLSCFAAVPILVALAPNTKERIALVPGSVGLGLGALWMWVLSARELYGIVRGGSNPTSRSRHGRGPSRRGPVSNA